MKKLLSLCVLCLLIGITTAPLSSGQDHDVKNDVRDRLAGAWRLAWLEEPAADGNIHRADATGLLVYTRDGHMAVQVMYRNPEPTASDSHVQYAQGGYEASFGTYVIDEGAHTFTYHVDGALVRPLIGKDLPRAFEFSGKQLIVKSTHAEEHWRVAWERD